MKMTKLQQEMFDESYRHAGKGGFPSYADLMYFSDLEFVLVSSRKRGAVRKYRSRTSRGRAIVRRNWMRRFPKLFTKTSLKEAGL